MVLGINRKHLIKHYNNIKLLSSQKDGSVLYFSKSPREKAVDVNR